jgi:hypothetical protein
MQLDIRYASRFLIVFIANCQYSRVTPAVGWVR